MTSSNGSHWPRCHSAGFGYRKDGRNAFAGGQIEAAMGPAPPRQSVFDADSRTEHALALWLDAWFTLRVIPFEAITR
jgi:hypothetical protein